MAWKGEKNRHSMAARGVVTVPAHWLDYDIEPYTENWHKQFKKNNAILDRLAKSISMRTDVLSEAEVDNMIGIVTNDLELADNLLAIKEGENKQTYNHIKELFGYDENISSRDIRAFIDSTTKDELRFMYNHNMHYTAHS